MKCLYRYNNRKNLNSGFWPDYIFKEYYKEDILCDCWCYNIKGFDNFYH